MRELLRELLFGIIGLFALFQLRKIKNNYKK